MSIHFPNTYERIRENKYIKKELSGIFLQSLENSTNISPAGIISAAEYPGLPRKRRSFGNLQVRHVDCGYGLAVGAFFVRGIP
jgi:hypothetical protein